MVSPSNNVKEIELEVFRLARAKEVLEALKAYAREAKISISQGKTIHYVRHTSVLMNLL